MRSIRNDRSTGLVPWALEIEEAAHLEEECGSPEIESWQLAQSEPHIELRKRVGERKQDCGLPSEGVVHPTTEGASQTGSQTEQSALTRVSRSVTCTLRTKSPHILVIP